MPDLNTLNDQQRYGVETTEGPVLLLAGAGSGKTKVITTRIAYLLKWRGVPAENILAVTFTNKAAAEMKERVEGVVGKERAKNVLMATFHSLCVRILRQDIERLGYRKNFTIYSESDQVGLMRQTLRDAAIDTKKGDAELLLWKISSLKNNLTAPRDFRPGTSDLDRLTAEIYPRYQRALKNCNAVDFDDLIMLTVELFREHEDILAKWQQRFRYIMIDEYQDTNASQFLLIRLLAEKHGNICVVGDDDQSIYGWRGADIENILGFDKQFPGCKVIKLEQNYRSTGNILAAANSVIRNNNKRKDKTLWTSSGSGAPIDLVVAADDEEEASAVVERIQAEKYRANLTYADFAILYRTNAQSRAFEEQLRFESIPYVLVGGFRFFDRKEVKDALSWLRAIHNPQDEQAIYRIINFPRRGIGETTIAKVNAWALENGKGLSEALLRSHEVEGIPLPMKEKIGEFVRLLEHWRGRLKKALDVAGATRELFAELKLEEELYRTAEDPSTGKRRVENVQEIINAIAAFETKNPRATVGDFLEKVSLMEDDRPGKNKKEHGQDAVTLMSLHSSKGLEFPHVFLVGMEEEILPHKRSIYEDFNIDEERRLCYVGITRARKHLTLTRCSHRKKYGKLEPRIPSRFLQELPEEILTVQEGARPAVSEDQADAMAKSFFDRMRSMMDD